MCTSLGLSRLSSVYVKHGCRAYAAVIDHTDGWRIVYSGDTRPYHVLAQAGRDATLLIHEATYPLEGLNEEDAAAAEAMAKKKYHSTTTEAVSVAQQ
jgi:ribonuclease Z